MFDSILRCLLIQNCFFLTNWMTVVNIDVVVELFYNFGVYIYVCFVSCRLGHDCV